jgi:hypothetical protein
VIKVVLAAVVSPVRVGALLIGALPALAIQR